jgi:hypothetical protein
VYASIQRSVIAFSLFQLSLAASARAQAPAPAAPESQPVAPNEARVPPPTDVGTSGTPAPPDTAAIAVGTPEPSSEGNGATTSKTTSEVKSEVRSEVITEAEAKARELPAWLDYFSIGGGLILYYYQPTSGDGDNNFNVFFANLLLDGKWENFGLHIEPRFRDSKLRSYFDGPAWLQEAYASGSVGPVTIKVGKSYKRLGLFWDNSFYGNVQVYDGLKLDPNYGVSVEGQVGGQLGVEFSAQYFIVDGGTNVSLANRDTLYVPGARRRNALVARVAPIYHFAEKGTAQVGVSAEHFTADLPSGEDGVTRVAGEAKVTYDGFGAWAEVLVQDGRHVTDFPYAGTATAPGRASGDNRYVLAGAEYGIGPVTLRYNLSFADYSDVDVTEIMHVPAVGLAVNAHLSVLAEYVYWTRDTNEGDVDVDKSLNLTFSGHF